MAKEVAVALALGQSGAGQLEASNAIVWDGKMKQFRDRRKRWVEREMYLSTHSCTVSLCLTPAGWFMGGREGGGVWFADPQHLYVLCVEGENGY